MPSNISNIPVGSDGHIPIYTELVNSNSRFEIWALDQLFMGQGTPGQGRWVGKPGDWAVDRTARLWYSIDAVDQVTFVPTLGSPNSGPITIPLPEDYVYTNTGNETQHLYYDDSVSPFVLTLDASNKVPGSGSSHARIFKGVVISDETKIISRIYDQVNQLISDQIPLVDVEKDDMLTFAYKTIEQCNTTAVLEAGEKVTAVVYSADNTPIWIRQFVVVKTTFARSLNVSRKHIVNISLKSPFISDTNPNLISFPLNVPLSGLNLTGTVHYSDGTKEENIPVNGSRFAITGYDYFAATQPNEQFEVTLHYYLNNSEYSYSLGSGPTRHISKDVTCRVTDPDPAFNIKLFGYPRWIDAQTGYRLRWFVGNLERTVMQEVTNLVTVNPNSAAFDPLLYGVVQTVVAKIQFNDINPAWRPVAYVQPMRVTLINPGTQYSGSNWSVMFNPDGTPIYGLECHARATMVNANLYQLDLTSNEVALNDWLAKFYYAVLPLKDPYTESIAPTPTHFIVTANGGIEYEFPIAQWNATLSINHPVTYGDTLMVKFIKRTVSQNAILLAVVGIPIWIA